MPTHWRWSRSSCGAATRATTRWSASAPAETRSTRSGGYAGRRRRWRSCSPALWTSGLSGAELLARVGVIHPHSRRALLIEWGAWGQRKTNEAIVRCMSRGEIDYYIPKPWQLPDEHFHRVVTEFLLEWTRARSTLPREIAVVGEPSSRVHELRSLLARNGMAHAFHATDSDGGKRLLETTGHAGERGPVVVFLDGRSLVNPSNTQLAAGYGVNTEVADPDELFDVIIVGAGPAGLASSVYASSEGLSVLTIERESIGGQAGASSLIRNYLGFARGVGGADLAQRAYQQAWVFGSRFLLMSEVASMRTELDRHVLTTGGRSRAVRAHGRARHRRGVPEARHPGARGAGGLGRVLRRDGPRGGGRNGRTRLRARRRQLGGPGRDAALPLRRMRDDPRARRDARGQHVPVPARPARCDRERGAPALHGGGRRHRRGAPPDADSPRPAHRRDGDGARAGAVRAHRGAAEQRLAAGHDRAGRVRLRAHGLRPASRRRLAARAPAAHV